ncbi:Rhamnose utilisation protein RhaD, predicted bifunctional aldolase and dehydrogenase [Rhizobiales bacterium GAS188]|jgi:rhamnose utilization protein RhaD (predicted bifunctional aldolase and dehydrogenase)/NAD(P)-dependent dehydrogenase (short-subunit alcohol dehydrogenase family)|nr:Rhamnose utilisation protein RhaD, predicted bifunctional aldolase and dehydrogenase [Rhizobiales bacterium GAS188]
MESRWSDAEAARAVARYAERGIGEDLALRTYTARLLGADGRLVLHGGGNTSVKTAMHDVYGDEVRVLCVKGSGWDLATIEPAGHPAVRLDPLLRLRSLPRLSDEDMVNVQRANLLDSAAPNPSVETLLHAFIPHKFVDHTHSVASVSIADQPDAEEICRRIFADRIACVPYILPGFGLAKAAAAAFDANPRAEGLLLIKHGIFSFGATAREAYGRMIEFVTLCENYIAATAKPRQKPISPLPAAADKAKVLPLLRRAFAEAAGAKWPGRWLADLREGPEIEAFIACEELRSCAARGPVTPDHIIRLKGKPLFLDTPPANQADIRELDAKLGIWADAATEAVRNYATAYEAYFGRQNARIGGTKKRLDPLPRVVVIPGIGIVGMGKDKAEAKIAGDLIEALVRSILDAEAIGRFEPIGEDDQFDMEYWSLEQAKLGKAAERRLARHAVVVTGGAGAIGAATAKAFASEGADVAILDIDAAAAISVAASIGPNALGLACDVTDAVSVATAFARIVEAFGGVDILVSNAGTALTGMIAELPDATLRRSFEINFFGHQNVAREAVAIMKRQRLGGALLFNVSKQAVNPGPNFGAYGTSKAALLALVRQYALEHGADGIRANALNPDRIRSGLLSAEMIAERARARGVSEAEYMGGNLLRQEVTAEDVARAFVAQALMRKTTGDVMTVDGGNVAAMMR